MPSGPFPDSVRASAEEANGESYLIRVGGSPGDDAFELSGVVLDGANFDEFLFYNLGISHVGIVTRLLQFDWQANVG